jgi:hypothetical protein
MFMQPKSAVLPPPQDQTRLETEARLTQYAISESLFNAFLTPEYVRVEINKLWRRELSREPDVDHPKPYRMIRFVHISRAGEVYLEAAIRHGHTELYLGAGDPHAEGETDEDGEPAFVRVNASDMKLDKETEDWLVKKVWKVFKPVIALKAEPKIQPNTPCPCGAKREDGRPVKFKRCTCSKFH